MDPLGPLQPEVTAWVQATLNMLGYYPKLEIDGGWKHDTKEAIGRYQLDNDLTITGIPDQNTVEDMLDELIKWNRKRTR